MRFSTAPPACCGTLSRFAHQVGVKTCVGTETPLVIPKLVQERLKALGKNPADPAVVQELYEGIFRRAAEAYPLDYYWFWTPEGWTWSGVKEEEIKATMDDLADAIAAHAQGPGAVQPGDVRLGARAATGPRDVRQGAAQRRGGELH